MTIVEIKNLTKSYQKERVLDKINLSVASGELIGLLGENGAGKSTLINIINHLVSASSGEVKLLLSKEKIGVMLQNNIVLNRVKVREALQLARSYYKNPLPYKELLRLSELTDHENAEMTKLSGGQKRRLTFALALAGNPDLVFLDEPTTGMDAERRAAFWQEIVRMQQEGKTFFITSHYLEELENIASRLLILSHHHISFDGSLAELRQRNAQSEVTFNFDGTLPPLQEANQINVTGNYYRLTTDKTTELVKELVPLLDTLSNLTIKQNSLDNIFQKLVKEDNKDS